MISKSTFIKTQKGCFCQNPTDFWKGKHLSEETKKKMSEANKGRIPWNKGLKKEKKDE